MPAPIVEATPSFQSGRNGSAFSAGLLRTASISSGSEGSADFADSALPSSPEPEGVYPDRGAIGDPAAEPAAGIDHYEVAPSATWHQIPFSRVGIGADLSPLGIGIKGAIVLNHYFDARLMGNFLGVDTGRFEIEGFNVDAKVHMASAGAALDWYPFGSVFRLSPGVLFVNGNQISATANITPGTSFNIETTNYYSANPNPVTGATPLTGTGTLGLHRNVPAVTLTTGFGKFIPRSNRHWSFPFELGVALTGAATIDVKMSGWACLDARQTQCSNIGDPTNPIAIEFNHDLQERLDKWRTDLNKVEIYPLISTSVVYSFNIR